MSIELEIKNIIADQLGRKAEEIKLTDHVVNDLGADSLDLVEIVMALEDHFKITIPDDEANNLKIVELIVNKVTSLKQ